TKGLHLAIEAIKKLNSKTGQSNKLLIAGKHYSGTNDNYWQKVERDINGQEIQYLGFIKDQSEKNRLLANAKALIIPSIFDEPFGMVMIEALASGTPLIG